MVKVCVICAGLPPHYGGAELRAYRHAQRLHTLDGVEAILLGWDRSEERPVGARFASHVHPVRLRSRAGGGARTPVRFVSRLGEIGLRLGWLLWRLRHRFDVVHVINGSPWFNLMSIPPAKALGKPVILEMTSLGSDDPLKLNRRSQTPEQQVFPHRPLKYTLFLKADAYVSKSPALTEAYRQAGLPESKLTEIPSGVDVKRFRPPTPAEKQALQARLGLESQGILILFVGGMYELKGVHWLLAAFRHIAPQPPQAQLLIVGPTAGFDPSYVQTLHDDTAAWGLSDRVTFVHQQVDNVEEYMKAADIYAHPSRREGLSGVILEAMSSGLAIVASDIPEIAQGQIEHGLEGLLTPVGDVDQLASALAALIESAALRHSLGQAARERVMREFTQEEVDRQYLCLYRSLCG